MSRTTLFSGYSIGADAVENAPAVCAPFGHRVVLIGGPRALEAVQGRILAALKSSSIEVTGVYGYDDAKMTPPAASDADMIFAVGGGRAMDAGKALAHALGKPLFTLPTVASTCAGSTSLRIPHRPGNRSLECGASDTPPRHIFIDPQIIANAPDVYLRSGLGGALAQCCEYAAMSREALSRPDAMGAALAEPCAASILRWGQKALADCRRHRVTDELAEVILSAVVSSGMLSDFLQKDGALGFAHAMWNGFAMLPSTVRNRHLHGEVAAYGGLVLLTMGGLREKQEKIYAFNRSVGLPTRLSDLHATCADLPAVADLVVRSLTARACSSPLTAELLIQSIVDLEVYNDEHERA